MRLATTSQGSWHLLVYGREETVMRMERPRLGAAPMMYLLHRVLKIARRGSSMMAQSRPSKVASPRRRSRSGCVVREATTEDALSRT